MRLVAAGLDRVSLSISLSIIPSFPLPKSYIYICQVCKPKRFRLHRIAHNATMSFGLLVIMVVVIVVYVSPLFLHNNDMFDDVWFLPYVFLLLNCLLDEIDEVLNIYTNRYIYTYYRLGKKRYK